MKKNKESTKFLHILKEINKDLKNNNHELILNKLMLALEIEPKNYTILNEIGNFYAIKGKYDLALEFHNKAASINFNNANILCNVGLDLYRLDRLQEAIQFFEFAIDTDKKYFMAYSGLATVYHSLGDINNLYKLSIQAIVIFPNRHDFHLNLGISLIYLERLEEALFCIETALILEPNSLEAKINKAAAYSKMGNHQIAIQIYEEIIEALNNSSNSILNSVKFNLSFEYLFMGFLEKGWDYYDFGFADSIPYNQRRKPNRTFKALTWHGDSLDNKTLMVWREQGLGDEILFLSMIPDLMRRVNSLIIECDPRLVAITRRSFPKAIVREPIDLPKEDYDFQIPMGGLCKYFRSKINNFNSTNPHLFPQICTHVDASNFLQLNSKKILIGICWRSGLLNIQRNNNYIQLNEWGEIFRIPNAIFVNLQYGECEEELKNAEIKFNISIARWNSIDMKNDLDTVFGIIKALDYIVTPATAVSSMAYSIGKKTLVFQPSRNWTNLGTTYYPWSIFMHQFIPHGNSPISSTLKDIAKFIIEDINVNNK